MDSMKQQLDIEKLTLAVDNVVLGLLTNKTTTFKHYHDTEYIVKRDLLIQLVVNKIVLEQIYTKREEATKRAFHALRNRWIDLIHKDATPLWKFSVDETKLKSQIAAKGLTKVLASEIKASQAHNQHSSQASIKTKTQCKRYIQD